MKKYIFSAVVAAVIIAAAWYGTFVFYPPHATISACEKVTLDRLKSPSTAKFSGEKIYSEAESATHVKTLLDEIDKQRTQVANASATASVAAQSSDISMRIKGESLEKEASDMQARLTAVWSTLYDLNSGIKEHPVRLMEFAVDSQNSWGASVRSNGICVRERNGVAVLVSLDQR